jgi:hypothetical protein
MRTTHFIATIILFSPEVNSLFSQSMLVSCESNVYDCPVLEQPDNQLSTNWQVSGTDISIPCFNPNNSNQFLFVKKLEGIQGSTICVHDLETGISNCLTMQHGLLFQPRWHSSNWVIFTGNYGYVYRVNMDGGEIQQISTNDLFKRPIWRPDGQTWIANTSLNAEGDIEVYSLDGSIDELIPGVEFNMGDWSAENGIVTKYGNSSLSYQLAWSGENNLNWQILDFDTPPNNHSLTDLKWIPMSNEVMFSQGQKDISKINVLTQEIQMVRDGCYDRYYGVFSISHDGSKIVAERFLTTHYYTEGLYNYKVVKKEIVIMNCDGTDETVIDLEGSIMVSEEEPRVDVQVFPNPAREAVNIKSEVFIQNAPIRLFDALGREVYSKRMTGMAETLDLQSLPAGLYVLQVGAGKELRHFKIVKE